MSSVHSAPYRQFLQLLRAARLDAGLTQAEAAAELGKPQSFVSKCESGERRVDVIELEAIANVYQKPIQYFLPRPSKYSKTRGRSH